MSAFKNISFFLLQAWKTLLFCDQNYTENILIHQLVKAQDEKIARECDGGLDIAHAAMETKQHERRSRGQRSSQIFIFGIRQHPGKRNQIPPT